MSSFCCNSGSPVDNIWWHTSQSIHAHHNTSSIQFARKPWSKLWEVASAKPAQLSWRSTTSRVDGMAWQWRSSVSLRNHGVDVDLRALLCSQGTHSESDATHTCSDLETYWNRRAAANDHRARKCNPLRQLPATKRRRQVRKPLRVHNGLLRSPAASEQSLLTRRNSRIHRNY